MKNILNIIVIILVVGFFVGYGITGCGQMGDVEVRKGFYLNTTKIQVAPDQINGSFDVNFAGKAIDKFQKVYGSCNKDIFIELRESSFYSEDLNQKVSGLTYNHGNSCEITVGVNPKSTCETSQILWHELYHCCNNISTHGNWAYDLLDLSDAWEKEGQCS